MNLQGMEEFVKYEDCVKHSTGITNHWEVGLIFDHCMGLKVEGRSPRGTITIVTVPAEWGPDFDGPCSPEYRAAFAAEVERLFPK